VPKTLVQEVASGKSGVRVFVVHSEERLEYERGEREKAMQKVQEELEALEQRVAQGTKAAKILPKLEIRRQNCAPCTAAPASHLLVQ
jgi:hypothetical protein